MSKRCKKKKWSIKHSKYLIKTILFKCHRSVKQFVSGFIQGHMKFNSKMKSGSKFFWNYPFPQNLQKLLIIKFICIMKSDLKNQYRNPFMRLHWRYRGRLLLDVVLPTHWSLTMGLRTCAEFWPINSNHSKCTVTLGTPAKPGIHVKTDTILSKQKPLLL